MFPEYRDLIAKLRQGDEHFRALFDQHNDLDHKIIRLEKNPASSTSPEIADLKRQKLALKDEIYAYLKEKEKEGSEGGEA